MPESEDDRDMTLLDLLKADRVQDIDTGVVYVYTELGWMPADAD